MALPVMTPEQRAEALAKAHAANAARSAFTARVRSGTVTPLDALDDEAARNVKVRSLLLAVPGIGPVRARQVMEGAGIAETRRVRSLTGRQKAALTAELATF